VHLSRAPSKEACLEPVLGRCPVIPDLIGSRNLVLSLHARDPARCVDSGCDSRSIHGSQATKSRISNR